MNKQARKFLCLVLLFAAGAASAQTPFTARVKTDRVNLRARPDTKSEVVGQIGVNENITVKSMSGEWAELAVPVKFGLWVHSDFVRQQTVAADTLNVRAGAGINYTVVGTLKRNDPVVVRSTYGEWLEIEPPEAASLWVHKDLLVLESPEPPPPAPAPAPAVTTWADTEEPAPAETPAASNAVVQVQAAEDIPVDMKLVPLEGQGRPVTVEGELKPAPFVFGRPSYYRLVKRDGNRLDTVCYVRGNSKQLQSLMDDYLVIKGQEYWTKGGRRPVVMIESIENKSVR